MKYELFERKNRGPPHIAYLSYIGDFYEIENTYKYF